MIYYRQYKMKGGGNIAAKAKKMVALRLSDDTAKELNEIAKRQSVSQADVVTILTHLYYTNEDFENAEQWFDVVRMS